MSRFDPKRLVALALVFLLSPAARSALLVDNAEEPGPTHRFGGPWVVFHDPASTTEPEAQRFRYAPEGFQSAHKIRLEYELKPGAPYPFAGLLATFPARDLSSFEGVRFQARGEGLWNCSVPTSATAAEYNHYAAPIQVGLDWRLIEVPFSSLTQTWGNPHAWKPAEATGVQWGTGGGAGAKGWIDLDDVEFYAKKESRTGAIDSNPIRMEPKVNQQGYLPGSEKYFILTVRKGVKAGVAFRVRNARGEAVYSGKVEGPEVDATATTGEKVLRGDFSGFKTPGMFRVEATGCTSAAFVIGEDVYRPLYDNALKCFALIRCGAAVDDPSTGIRHAACHLKDAPAKENPKEKADLTGGWHNAQDYGKFLLEEAISCSWMMWLHELRGGTEPDAANLLAQARWGLDWMLKMQKADGSVRHKVDNDNLFCFGTLPENDPNPRVTTGAGSLDAADFIGATAQASRVYRKADPAFANKCAAAARRAWAWLEKNPEVTQKDPAYTDTDPSQEKIWALGEMARLTGDPALVERFGREAGPARLAPVCWLQPQFFGYLAMLTNPKATDEEKSPLMEAWKRMSDREAAASDADGYRVVLSRGEYYWESNENLLHRAACLLAAHLLTGEERYLVTALRQANYILGVNSLGLSFVAGHGERSVRHPYHWAMAALGKILPGWASGGPNNHPEGADPLLLSLQRLGTPPAKCFVDAAGASGSWASNEGETSENAALVFVSGYLSGGETADAPGEK